MRMQIQMYLCRNGNIPTPNMSYSNTYKQDCKIACKIVLHIQCNPPSQPFWVTLNMNEGAEQRRRDRKRQRSIAEEQWICLEGDVMGCSLLPESRIKPACMRTFAMPALVIAPGGCSAGCSAEWGRLRQPGFLVLLPLSLLRLSSLLPTRLTPKVALIGMGSDSHPVCLRNF